MKATASRSAAPGALMDAISGCSFAMSAGFPKVILEPYPKLTDAKVALTAWSWLYKLPTVDQTQIVRFFRAHYDPVEAPERGTP